MYIKTRSKNKYTMRRRRPVSLIQCGLLLCILAACGSSAPEPVKLAAERAAADFVPLNVSSVIQADASFGSVQGEHLPERLELYFFYEQLCEICNELDAFYATLAKQFPEEIRNAYPYIIYTINIVETEGRLTYERVTDEMGLDRHLLEAPLLIAGGRVFQGQETIANNIQEAFLTAGEDLFVNKRFYNPAAKKTGEHLFDDYSIKSDHVTLVYFYRIVCPYCVQVTPVINALPDTITVDGKQTPLDIIRINTRSGNNNERINAFFEAYGVPDADRTVPIIFLADTYLSGVERISAELSGRLETVPSTNTLQGLIPAISKEVR